MLGRRLLLRLLSFLLLGFSRRCRVGCQRQGNSTGGMVAVAIVTAIVIPEGTIAIAGQMGSTRFSTSGIGLSRAGRSICWESVSSLRQFWVVRDSHPPPWPSFSSVLEPISTLRNGMCDLQSRDHAVEMSNVVRGGTDRAGCLSVWICRAEYLSPRCRVAPLLHLDMTQTN